MFKKIIMIAALGLISFGAAFAVGWFTKPEPISDSDASKQPGIAASDFTIKPMLPQPDGGTAGSIDQTAKTAMMETRLKSLAIEIRDKIEEYNNKIEALEQQAQRLTITRDSIKKDIENLNNLQIELASTVAGLKEKRAKLLKTRVDIEESEKANLVTIAATYDKMDSKSASEILTNMCKSKAQTTGAEGQESGFNDALKILHYMTERTKAKVLAELVSSEPQLASLLCQKLKQISEI